MTVEQLIAELAQQIEGRYYGKYRSFVVDNADPEHLGRLKLQVPSLLGSEVVTGWALPCVPYGGLAGRGALFVPEIGAGVWVEFEEGDLEFPIWVGTFWSKPEGENELPHPAAADGARQDSPQSAPTRKILTTAKGHSLQFEDADDEEHIILVAQVAEAQQHTILLNRAGISITDGVNAHRIVLDDAGITLTDGVNGHRIVLDNAGITLTDGVNGHRIVLDDAGITLTDKQGSAIEIGKDAFKLIAKVPFTIDASGQAVTIIGATIDLN